MKQKTWIYLILLIVVLIAAGLFFWWNYRSGKVTPKAETTTPTQTYADVPAGDPNNNNAGQHWAYNQIEAVTAKGYMVGYEHVFAPTSQATRATVAIAVARAYAGGTVPTYTGTPTFSDCADVASCPAFNEIEFLATHNPAIVTGVNGAFLPNQAADRATAAIIVAKAHAFIGQSLQEIPAYAGSPTFSDCLDAQSCPGYNEIEYLATLTPPVFTGVNGAFLPTTVIDRQTLAVVMAKDKQLNISSPPATPSFSDVPTSFPTYAYIEAVNTAGIMTGVNQKLFLPDAYATRAMVAVAIGRATNNIYDNPTPTFPDVAKDYWAYKEIEGVNHATPPIMVGSNGLFDPEGIADRRTVAIVLARAKNLTLDASGAQVFADVNPGEPGYAEVNAIYKAGYTRGCGANSAGAMIYCPNEQITRAVLAAFVYNGFILTSPTPPSLPPVTPSATATPSTTSRGTGSGSGSTGAATTGAELPLASAGVITTLFAIRYLIGRKTR